MRSQFSKRRNLDYQKRVGSLTTEGGISPQLLMGYRLEEAKRLVISCFIRPYLQFEAGTYVAPTSFKNSRGHDGPHHEPTFHTKDMQFCEQ
jgi:hypothetical protein